MSKWKLARQNYGEEVFTLSEGDALTIGRGLNNNISLSSVVISRNHCEISVQKNIVLITDLKSSNGVYVGPKKIPPNTPYVLKDSDIIGFGWTDCVSLVNITNNDKYTFKLIKDKTCSLIDKIKFQGDENDVDEIETKLSLLDSLPSSKTIPNNHSPVLSVKPKLKRKSNETNLNSVFKEMPVVSLLSDSETEINAKCDESEPKKLKLEPICEEENHNVIDDSVIKTEKSDLKFEAFNVKQPICEEEKNNVIDDSVIKTEKSDLEFEAFNVKQEYLGYDNEPIEIDSDSDSESEHWFLRLSQSSPGKPFTKVGRDERQSVQQEDSSYSQLDDVVEAISNNYSNIENDEDYEDDLISIPPQPTNDRIIPKVTSESMKHKVLQQLETDDEDIFENLITILPGSPHKEIQTGQDEVDCISSDNLSNQITRSSFVPAADPEPVIKTGKVVQVIEPLFRTPKTKIKPIADENKSKSTRRHSREHKKSSKRHISENQKEDRKKKLKEIAAKEKESLEQKNYKHDQNNSNKTLSCSAKLPSTNRGAFLTTQIVKPTKRKESSPKTKKDANKSIEVEKAQRLDDVENKIVEKTKKSDKSSKHKRTSKSKLDDKEKETSVKPESRVPIKSLKPLTSSVNTVSGKPCSLVEPLPIEKIKKQVRFSDAAPEVRWFEIEPGNKLKKTSLVKASLDMRQTPIFSLEKITLMKILRWNPQWLSEQMNNNEPPPILGHNNPTAMFHSFQNHHQYIQIVGDLLLMEIWESLTQAYSRVRHQPKGMEMKIESLPPVPSQDRYFDLINISVNISVPKTEFNTVPRMGELMVVSFGAEETKNLRFFFVHNVRCLPSPQNNKFAFYSVSLHATYTDKMRHLRPGEPMIGKTLAYINNELMLFHAMEYLAGSPLCNAILNPQPEHFVRSDVNLDIRSQWTVQLNPSQQEAVKSSIAAALGDQPRVQMVQGPPGTGKSSVICAMVMTYFYDTSGRRQNNRDKILICATSNTAVDELVIRLLEIRQKLPKTERFRMVRVGRAEAMCARARDVSSLQLASRDAQARMQAAPEPSRAHEISHLEAKINMHKANAQDSKDPSRKAYCHKKVMDLEKKIAMLRSNNAGGGDGLRPEHLAQAERRIIEGADIVLSTLSSVHNNKMRGLKHRIALCIVDEAGQAIEPQTLVPLTLDVTCLTLIGDPQQLPGYICSQRAKQYGLGDSLFCRLTSCTEQWPRGSPVLLLNEQYRMHPHIADYPNRAFYGGKIITRAPIRDVKLPPYAIVGISSGDKGQDPCGANETEAWGVARLVRALHGAVRAGGLALAVITPYNAHKDLIKKNLRLLQDSSEPVIEVNTVDSFQGQERDVVVVSLARSCGVGFLTEAGRMNVMLTRAKHSLIVCLNPHAIVRNPQWQTLVQDSQQRKLYRMLPNKMCQHPSVTKISSEEVLQCIGENSNYTNEPTYHNNNRHQKHTSRKRH